MRLPPGDYFNGWLGMGNDKIQMGLHGDNFLRHGACLVLSSPLDMGGFWRSPAHTPVKIWSSTTPPPPPPPPRGPMNLAVSVKYGYKILMCNMAFIWSMHHNKPISPILPTWGQDHDMCRSHEQVWYCHVIWHRQILNWHGIDQTLAVSRQRQNNNQAVSRHLQNITSQVTWVIDQTLVSRHRQNITRQVIDQTLSVDIIRT